MALASRLVLAALLGQPLVLQAIVPAPVAAQGRGAGAATVPVAALDYEVFKSKIQPILTSPRTGHARCSACHAGAGGNSYLEPLPPGSDSYTEEQSRRNFARVARLVTPGDPMKSILLINPLEATAGGTEWHGGGKHWQSQADPEWATLANWVLAKAASTPTTDVIGGLNYETFKTKVEPILTSARKGHARCSACHAGAGGNSYLEPLPPGSDTYTEEQSRRNFARVSRLVTAGQPLKSILLTNPLEAEAGGSEWHGGGKHWRSQNDAEWKILASWVSGN